jgi:membrane protein required for colicin V production
MNWLDISILCLAAAGLVKGLYDGAIKLIVSLIALVLGIFFCGRAAGLLHGYILQWNVFGEHWATIVCYALGFILIAGVLMLAGMVMHRLVGATPLTIVNHIGGGIFGLLIMLLLISFFFNMLELVNSGAAIISRETRVESKLYHPVQKIIPAIYPRTLSPFMELEEALGK